MLLRGKQLQGHQLLRAMHFRLQVEELGLKLFETLTSVSMRVQQPASTYTLASILQLIHRIVQIHCDVWSVLYVVMM